MTDKETMILGISERIRDLSGSYPDEIEEKEDGLLHFEIKIAKTALDVFPHDEEEPWYTLVNTEINGEEKGWYEETLLFAHRPNHETPGYLIEGLYGRYIEYTHKPDAVFFGTYREVKPEENWDTLLEEARARYEERTAEKLLNYVENEMRCLSELTARLSSQGSGAALRERYRNMMQYSLRRHLGGDK